MARKFSARSVVGAACRPPVQFYLAANARCRIPVPAPCRAGACPRRAVLPRPQILRPPGRCPGFDSLFWIRCGPHGSASNFRRCRARFMAPVPGPVLSEPTLRVGFASRLFLWARLRGIAPQAKNQKKPPLVPRRGARPRGLRAPLETPGLCGGRPRLFPCFTAFRSFLPWPRPVPAGTAHPGSRSETPPAFAGGRNDLPQIANKNGKLQIPVRS